MFVRVKKIFLYIRTPYALNLYLILAIVCAIYLLVEQLGIVAWPTQLHWRFGPLVMFAVVAFWATFAGAWRQNLRLTTGVTISLGPAIRQAAMLLVGKYLPGKLWGVFARERDAAKVGFLRSQVYSATYLEQLKQEQLQNSRNN